MYYQSITITNKHVARADVGTPANIMCEGVTIDDDDENVDRLSYAQTLSGRTEKLKYSKMFTPLDPCTAYIDP